MTPSIRPLTIALMVALLAAAVPAQASVRPSADHRFDKTAALTPVPLDGRIVRFERSGAAHNPTRPPLTADRRTGTAADVQAEAEARAAEAGSRDMTSLLAFSGLGAVIIVLVTLMVIGQDPRGGRTA